MLKVVVLILTVTNCDTGVLIYKNVREMPSFSVSGDRIEDCRIEGVAKAKELVEWYRATYPNASANVDCQWESRIGDPA